MYQTLNILFSVVENYVKKNHNRFPIAVFLTTLIYSPYTTTFFFSTIIYEFFGAYNILLEKYYQNLSKSILQAPKFQEFKILSSRCPTLFDETCGSKFKGQGMEEIACLMGCDVIQAHRGWTCLSTFITLYRCLKMSLAQWENLVYKAPQKIFHQKNIITAFLCHGPLPFPTRPPLLPFSPQNLLDHVSAFIRHGNLYFGDLDLHGPSAIFSLV